MISTLRRTANVRVGFHLLFLCAYSALSTGCGESPNEPESPLYSDQGASPARVMNREPCLEHVETRRALFGDLHVHTARSMDAFLFDTRTTPSDAYRFAKGEELFLAPLDKSGRGINAQRIDRPLDFAAVTDHAENFGPVSLCTMPDSAVYDSSSCVFYRGDGKQAEKLDFLSTVQLVRDRSAAVDSDEVCGSDGRRCRDADTHYWQEMQRAAERHYDRSSACRFTTFVAYEYSYSPELSKVHRNIIFRNENVIERPIHALAEPEPITMLKRLRDECNDGNMGCEALAIPHNSNLSDGRMFRTEYAGAANRSQDRRLARLRAEMEPVIEIFQVKGDSECRNGLLGVGGPIDELCGFEKMRSIASKTEPPDCEGGIGAGSLIGRGCVDRNDFARTALVAGLAEELRIGANPFEFGFIGSTDAHDGTMGNVAESGPVARGELAGVRVNTNPGGLAGVWAEENSRDAIFDAIARRETFATSGPRIEPRFFGGGELPSDLCERSDAIETAYANGVPMGGELEVDQTTPPRFFVSADRDPGTASMASNALERIQIIKGWSDSNGTFQTRVFDVAGQPIAEDDLNPQTCEPIPSGRDTLCGVWQDPTHDPEIPAVYYARVLEAPSCRWSRRLCMDGEDEHRPPFCDDPTVPVSIRERAWTSPIWVKSKS